MVEFEAAPLSEVAEAGAVFEQGLSKQSKVALRSGRVQHGSTWFNMVQHGSTWFNMVQHGSTWFNIVQRHFTPSSLPQFLSLSVTESQCIGGVDAANGQSEAMKH